jgi:type VI secretion system secreted protein VgrG
MVLAHVVTPAGSDAVRNWPYYTPEDFDPGRQWLEDTQGTQRKLNAKGVYVRFSCDPPGATPVWVKLAAHMQTVPEVGCSVWISRANDESELPEIQNIVQADGSRTIVDSGWTAHTQVGNSYSTSYGDSRSLRFGQPWTQAIVDEAVELVETAYAKGIYRDASYSRGGSYGYSTTEQHEKGVLNESWSYGSTYNNMWAKESKSFSAIGRSYHESVTGRSDTSLSSTESEDPDAMAAVSASRSVVWGDTYANSVSHGNTKTISVYDGNLVSDTTHGGNIDSTTTVQGTSTSTSTHHAKVSNTSTINADSDNVSTITGTSTNRSTHNIVHNFSAIAAQSSSTAIGASNSNDAVGVSNANSATGVTNRNSAVGVSIDLSVQGMGNAVSATGMENRVVANGMSNTVNVNGESNTVNMVGASTSIEIAGPGAQMGIKSDQAKIDLDGPVVQIPVIVLVL